MRECGQERTFLLGRSEKEFFEMWAERKYLEGKGTGNV